MDGLNAVYIKYTRERKREFQTETKIIRSNQRCYVEKRNLCAEGGQHVLDIYNNTLSMRRHFPQVNIAEPYVVEEETSRVLRYQYVEGLSWDKRFKEIINKGDLVHLIEELFRYKNFLYNLGPYKSFHCSDSFKNIFGSVTIPEREHALIVSNVDLILDNLILNEEGSASVTVLDCEWVYEFPIPVGYIFYRGLYALFIKYQRELYQITNFSDVCEKVGFDSAILHSYASMEASFQKHVHGNSLEYIKRYEKERYTIEGLKHVINTGRFYSQVLLPRRGVYTYEKTNFGYLDHGLREYWFRFDAGTENHIRFDPINQWGVVQLQSIEVFTVSVNGLLSKVADCNAENSYSGLTWSDDVQILSHDNMKFIGRSDTHLFLSTPELQVDNNVAVKVVMSCSKGTDEIVSYYNDCINRNELKHRSVKENLNCQIELIKQQLTEKSLAYTSLQWGFAEAEQLNSSLRDQIGVLSSQISDDEVMINNLRAANQILHEQLMNVNQELERMRTSTSWRVTSPLRKISRFLRR